MNTGIVAGARAPGPNRLLLAAATVAIVAAVALLVTAPWEQLARHSRQSPSGPHATPRVGPTHEMGGDSTPDRPSVHCHARSGAKFGSIKTAPHRYRALLFDHSSQFCRAIPARYVCSKSTRFEWGGTLDLRRTGRGRSGLCRRTAELQHVTPSFSRGTPWQIFAQAITTGNAHDEGKTQLEGVQSNGSGSRASTSGSHHPLFRTGLLLRRPRDLLPGRIGRALHGSQYSVSLWCVSAALRAT